MLAGSLLPVVIAAVKENGGVLVDAVDDALVTVDFAHHEVHEGHAYECTVYSAAVLNNGTLLLGIDFPNDVVSHLVYDGGAGGDALLEFLEDPTFANGTPVTIFNLNRAHADYVVDALTAMTLGGAPTTLQATFLPGGSGPQAQGTVVSPRAGQEWITRAGAVYCVRLTNLSGQSQPANIRIAFYVPG